MNVGSYPLGLYNIPSLLSQTIVSNIWALSHVVITMMQQELVTVLKEAQRSKPANVGNCRWIIPGLGETGGCKRALADGRGA